MRYAVLAFLLALTLLGCGGSDSSESTPQASSGSGSTFANTVGAVPDTITDVLDHVSNDNVTGQP